MGFEEWGDSVGLSCEVMVRFRGCVLKTCEFFVCSASVDMWRVQCIVPSLTLYIRVFSVCIITMVFCCMA